MQIAGCGALVTGGASGLGAGTVRRLAALGATVTIADVNQEAGAALAAELGERVHFIATDVTSAEQMQAAVAHATAVAGALHVLVCCAGVATAERTLGKEGPLPLERFARVIAVNLTGTYNAVRLAAAAMARNMANDEGERGVIVCTASIAAFDGQVGQAAYSASKAGVVGMMLPLARELARHGIRIASIAPGMFDTPMLASLPEAAIAALAAQVPFPPRPGRPAEYAALAQHMIENPMLNGETIRLDGALRMAPR
ncbi:MAG: SDR family NAD(P)-dependent oxidoreductase [Chloroflexi bacterium]|nr:SDR family NAD(P)-dependent oxidoreductase [Chloroflexota bacterium]